MNVHVVGDVNSFMVDPRKKLIAKNGNWFGLHAYPMNIPKKEQQRRERKNEREEDWYQSIFYVFASMIHQHHFTQMRERVYHKMKRTYTKATLQVCRPFQVAGNLLHWFSSILWHQINVYFVEHACIYIHVCVCNAVTYIGLCYCRVGYIRNNLSHIRFGGLNETLSISWIRNQRLYRYHITTILQLAKVAWTLSLSITEVSFMLYI